VTYTTRRIKKTFASLLILVLTLLVYLLHSSETVHVASSNSIATERSVGKRVSIIEKTKQGLNITIILRVNNSLEKIKKK